MRHHDSETETTLLQAIASGKESAMQQLYLLWQPRLLAFVARRLGDRHDAEDVVHEVMLDIWRQAGRFEGRSRPLTWAMSIAHHKLVDRQRKHYREDTTDDKALFEGDDETDLSAAVTGARDAKRLHDCLGRLSDAHRTAVHLAFFEELSYPDIAEIIACPVGTVKTRLFHARKLLKDCLGESLCR